MRNALVAAVAAVCLVMPAHAAFETTTATSSIDRPSLTDVNDFRLHAMGSTQSGLKDQLKDAPHLRAGHHVLDYYPFADSGLHFSMGMQKDKRLAGTRSFNLRGVPMFGSDMQGFKRKVSPGFAVAYDQPLGTDGKEKLGFDIGMRKDRDAMASQLNRLASLDSADSHRLGARSSRFGPAAHLTFIHTF